MTPEEFTRSVSTADSAPAELSAALQALWWDAKGDWDKAHALAQASGAPDGSWVHAYLHRREGDDANAGYWYAKAGRSPAHGPLDEERSEIIAALLRY